MKKLNPSPVAVLFVGMDDKAHGAIASRLVGYVSESTEKECQLFSNIPELTAYLNEGFSREFNVIYATAFKTPHALKAILDDMEHKKSFDAIFVVTTDADPDYIREVQKYQSCVIISIEKAVYGEMADQCVSLMSEKCFVQDL